MIWLRSWQETKQTIRQRENKAPLKKTKNKQTKKHKKTLVGGEILIYTQSSLVEQSTPTSSMLSDTVAVGWPQFRLTRLKRRSHWTWNNEIYTPEDSHGTCQAGGFTNIFLEFSPRKLGKIPNLTNIFQMGWNHQLDVLMEVDGSDHVPFFSSVMAVPAVHLPGVYQRFNLEQGWNPNDQASRITRDPTSQWIHRWNSDNLMIQGPGCYPRQNPMATNVLMFLCFWTRCHTFEKETKNAFLQNTDMDSED